MKKDISKAAGVIKAYLETLEKNIEIEKQNGYYIATLPFITSSGHLVEICIRELEGGYIALSDMNNQISELWLSGVRVLGRKRNFVRDIVDQYKLELKGDEIIALAKPSEVGAVFNRMVQALLRIGDLRFLHEISRVKEVKISKKVEEILKRSNLRYAKGPQAILSGNIGKYRFDFVVFSNAHKNPIKSLEAKQPKYLRTFVEASAFEFGDVKEKDSTVFPVAIYDKENELWEQDKELLKILRVHAEAIPIQDESKIMDFLSNHK